MIGSRRNGPPVSDRGWKRPFDDPIPLSGGRQLVALGDAADYIMKLPKAEQGSRRMADRGRSPAPGLRAQWPDHDGAPA
jgi:hypothetical protein